MLSLDKIKPFFESEGYTILSTVYDGADKPLKLECPKGHILQLSWAKFKKGRRCKFCNGSRLYEEDVYSSFEEEGYKILFINGSLSKGDIGYMCDKGHVGKTIWGRWIRGSRCKACYIDRVKTNFIDIKKEIEAENDTIVVSDAKYYETSNNVTCICCTCGFTYDTTVNKWRRGHRCKQCGYKKLSSMFRHSTFFVKNALEIEGYKLLTTSYVNALTPIEVECPKGHNITIKWRDWAEGCRCPICNSGNKSSKGEKQIGIFIESLNVKIETNNRSIISPYELDIVIPEKKIAIEYCGLYWHSELMGKDRNYHLNKLKACEEKGYRLITIFEDEWINKRHIVESKLLHLFGSNLCRRVYARKCVIHSISYKESKAFCNDNHLQGSDLGNVIRLGLFFQEELISVMTLSKPSIAKGIKRRQQGILELSRFCSKLGVTVVGGFSKLLAYLRRNFEFSEIYSYVDLRWFSGESYTKVGFTKLSQTKPNYWYSSDGLNRKHRFSLRKKIGEPKEVTESELRLKEGYYRIWDCGNLKYVLKNE